MASLSVSAIEDACRLVNEYDEKNAEKVKKYEGITDEYEDRLGTYLVRISEESILETEKIETSQLLHMIGDIERISDHAVNIAESADEMNDKNISFSDNAKAELSVIISAVNEITLISYEAIKNQDYALAASVEPLEEVIDDLRDEIKKRHIERLQRGECTIEQGFVLTDILTNLERVADHCSNLAGCFIEMSKYNAMDMHDYLKKYRAQESDFEKLFAEFSKKYSIR